MPVLQRLRGPLPPALVAQVRALAAAAEAHDRVEALGEQSLLHLSAGHGALHLLATAGRGEPVGALIGYARLDDADAELVVAPTARRAGLGRALLDALVAEALRPEVGTQLRVWAHGDLPAGRALAEAAGLRPVRTLWRMGRALAGDDGPATADAPDRPPNLGLPLGLSVRAAVPGQDDAAWLALNAAAFAAHPEQGRMTMADLDVRRREPWFDPADLLLVEATEAPGGRSVVATVWLKVTGGLGEIYVLGVHPSAQGRGLGGALTRLALAHLRSRGVRRVVLFTEADNPAAVATYRRAGFAVERSDVQWAAAGTGPQVPAKFT